VNVKVLSEWVRFRIFDEKSKQQKELKAPKGLLAPPFTIVVVQERTSSCKRTIDERLSCQRNIDERRL